MATVRKTSQGKGNRDAAQSQEGEQAFRSRASVVRKYANLGFQRVIYV